jgi:NTP pyrophosphatase (non-canonical NTP hydrolase)
MDNLNIYLQNKDIGNTMPIKYDKGKFNYVSGDYSFDIYSKAANKTASYHSVDYLPLGLAEEVGELIHEYARVKRTGDCSLNKDSIKSEIGDILWVLSQMAEECGFELADAARYNIKKLQNRKEHKAIHDKTNR